MNVVAKATGDYCCQNNRAPTITVVIGMLE